MKKIYKYFKLLLASAVLFSQINISSLVILAQKNDGFVESIDLIQETEAEQDSSEIEAEQDSSKTETEQDSSETETEQDSSETEAEQDSNEAEVDIESSISLEEDYITQMKSVPYSGIVQFELEPTAGQEYKEGVSHAEIKAAIINRSHPNRTLTAVSGGVSTHDTYVNASYGKDALYIGEQGDYYRIYISGYEGLVKKNEGININVSLDLNGDKQYVTYTYNATAKYYPFSTTIAAKSEEEYAEPMEVELLEYSDQTIYINEADPVIISSRSTAISPSYYLNENGDLYHYLTKDVTGQSYTKFLVGPAPNFMKQNVKYYSYDGIYFYNQASSIRIDGLNAVNAKQPFYNYYQYLSYRSTSNYSGLTFDNYTKNTLGLTVYASSCLKEDKVNKTCANPSNESKLVGAGQYFENIQSLYGVNGALEYAMSIHEGGRGRSYISLTKNNLFGMKAYDDNTNAATAFSSVQSGVYTHAKEYISWGYTDPLTDSRYYGAHVGNKGSGMNVKYASDPYWGEKIAGWYYKIDKQSGMKDYNYYSIGIKQTHTAANIRSAATTSSSVLYQTKNKRSNKTIRNYPVLIVGAQGDYYKIKTDTPIVNGVAKFDGQYDWNTTNGYIVNSVVEVVNHHSYRSPLIENSDLRGWQFIGDCWYYYDLNGKALTGWQWIDGIKYYFDRSGQMITGWQFIDNYWFYFNESGHMVQWWQWIDGIHYYFNGMGQMLTGWQWIDGSRYYFNQSGHSMTGLQLINNNYYFFDDLGKMLTGWHFIENSWYYFNQEGAALTGWQWIDGIKYYFDKSGQMITGWQFIDNYWFYFNESGHMVQWWQWIDGIQYYFNGMGQMLTGWQWIDEAHYYFNNSGHVIRGWSFMGESWYYFNDLGQRVSGWQNIDGIIYYFNNIGHMLKGYHTIDGVQHYFNESGHMIY